MIELLSTNLIGSRYLVAKIQIRTNTNAVHDLTRSLSRDRLKLEQRRWESRKSASRKLSNCSRHNYAWKSEATRYTVLQGLKLKQPWAVSILTILAEVISSSEQKDNRRQAGSLVHYYFPHQTTYICENTVGWDVGDERGRVAA